MMIGMIPTWALADELDNAEQQDELAAAMDEDLAAGDSTAVTYYVNDAGGAATITLPDSATADQITAAVTAYKAALSNMSTGSRPYVTMADALKMFASGDTLMLYSDVSLVGENINQGEKDLTLALNGKTLTIDNSTEVMDGIGNKDATGTLTIKNGTIAFSTIDENFESAIVGGAKDLVVENVTVKAEGGVGITVNAGSADLTGINVTSDDVCLIVVGGATYGNGVTTLANSTLTLNSNIEGNFAVGVGYNTSSSNTANNYYAELITSGTNTIKGTGDSDSGVAALWNSKVEINEGTTIEGTVYGIDSNNKRGSMTGEITINGGTIKGEEAGIYHPQVGTLTIKGGTISGKTALAVKAGTINISGGAFEATGAFAANAVNNDGIGADGSAIQIENNEEYKKPEGLDSYDIAVAISGGTFTSRNSYGVHEYIGWPIGSSDKSAMDSNPTITISGGTFNSAKDSVKLESRVTNFITGGTFSTDPSGSSSEPTNYVSSTTHGVLANSTGTEFEVLAKRDLVVNCSEETAESFKVFKVVGSTESVVDDEAASGDKEIDEIEIEPEDLPGGSASNHTYKIVPGQAIKMSATVPAGYSAATLDIPAGTKYAASTAVPTVSGTTATWAFTMPDVAETSNVKFTETEPEVAGKRSVLWTTDTYKLTFNPNGGSWTDEPDPIAYKKGDAADAINAKLTTTATTGAVANDGGLTRTNFTFTGWGYYKSEGDTKLTAFEYKTDMAKDYELYAMWTGTAITVTYKAGQGTFTDNITVGDGKVLSVDKKTYTVSGSSGGYTAGGAALSASPQTAQTLVAAANVTAPAGYTFSGWRDTATKKEYAAGSDMTFEANTTLEAVYTSDSDTRPITVTFHSNTKSEKTATQEMTTGVGAVLTANASLSGGPFANTGYSFGGWALSAQDAAAGTVKYQDAESVRFTGTEDPAILTPVTTADGSVAAYTLDLYAVWTGAAVTVTFDPGYANNSATQLTTSQYSGTMAKQTFSMGTAQAISDLGFTRNNYSLKGWALTTTEAQKDYKAASVFITAKELEAGTKIRFKDNNTNLGIYKSNNSTVNATTYSTSGGAATFYAVWVPDTVTVVFQNEDDDVYGRMNKQEYTVGATGVALTANAFYRAGYTFSGWNTVKTPTQTERGTAYANKHLLALTEANEITNKTITLYPQWTAKNVAVTLNANNGTPDGTFSAGLALNKETEIPASANPTRDGYDFAGWALDKDGESKAFAYNATKKSTTVSITGSEDEITFAAKDGTDAGSVTLYAMWTAKSATITYSSADSKTAPTAYGTKTFVVTGKKVGETVKLLSAEATGLQWNTNTYMFGGWQIGNKTYTAGEDYEITNTAVTVKLLLAPVSTSLPLTIVYHQNDGSTTDKTAVQNDSNLNGATKLFTAAQADFSRTGYTFAGWAKSSAASAEDYVGGATQVFAESDTNSSDSDGYRMNLYAMWTANEISVTFDKGAEDATGTTAASGGAWTSTSNAKTALSANGFKRNNYVFGGWALAKDAATALFTDQQQVSYADLVSYVDFLNDDGDAVATDTLKLYAVWLPQTVTITYKPGEAQGEDTTQVISYNSASGATYALQANPYTLDNYTFNGWTGGNNPANPADKATFDTWAKVLALVSAAAGANSGENYKVTLTASWTRKSMTVTYNANGDGASVLTPTQQITNAASTATSLVSTGVTRSGYTFAGWALTKDATEPVFSAANNFRYDLSAMTTKTTGSDGNYAVTLYAVWAAVPVKITYMPGNGTFDVSDTTVEATTATEVTLANAADFGGTADPAAGDKPVFAGWSTSNPANVSNAKAEYAAGQKAKFAADTTLYAIWSDSSSKFTVKFNGNGNAANLSGSVANMTGYAGQAVKMPENNFTLVGRDFVGWAKSSTASGSAVVKAGETLSWDAATIPASKEVTVYAIWKTAEFKVTYDGNGGVTGSGETIYEATTTYNTQYSVLGDAATGLTYAGRTFVSWNTKADGTGTTYKAGDKTPAMTADLTLYAIWASAPVSVTFNANNGTLVDTAAILTLFNVEDAEPLSALLDTDDVTRTGYTLKGWADSASADQPKLLPGQTVTYEDLKDLTGFTSGTPDSVTLYAVWGVNTYKFVYDKNGADGTETMAPSEYIFGTTQNFKLSKNLFTNTGHTFKNWKDASGNVYQAEQAINLDGTEDNFDENNTLTLFAQWEADKVVVTYVSGAVEKQDSKDGKYGEDYTVKGLSEMGFGAPTTQVFSGWAIKVEGKDTYTADDVAYRAGSVYKELKTPITLVAVMVNNEDVSELSIAFNANGGEGEMDAQTAETNVGVKLSKNVFTKSGSEFLGWAVTAAATAESDLFADEATITINPEAEPYKSAISNGTLTLYAIWSAAEKEVEILNTAAYKLGELTIPAAPISDLANFAAADHVVILVDGETYKALTAAEVSALKTGEVIVLLRGDANLDGEVDATDAAMTANAVNSAEGSQTAIATALGSIRCFAADANNDGEVGVTDCAKMAAMGDRA